MLAMRENVVAHQERCSRASRQASVTNIHQEVDSRKTETSCGMSLAKRPPRVGLGGGAELNEEFNNWWALRDSNPRPSPCKGDALAN